MLLQEAGQFFRSVIEPHKEEEQRSFEEMIPPDVPVKFFMEVTYPVRGFDSARLRGSSLIWNAAITIQSKSD